MGSQNSLEIDWSKHEIILKEDEVFFFQHQLPPLDLSNTYDFVPLQQDPLDATYFMDIISNNPIYPSMDILPDPNEDGFLLPRNGELGLVEQEMPIMNSLGFPNQEMHVMDSLGFSNQEILYTMTTLGFQNQEMCVTNSSGFSYQTQPESMQTKNINVKDDMNMVKEVEHKDVNGIIRDTNCDFNHPSKMSLSKEVISQYFYMPITQAAKELNIGLTLLKKRCRELGIRRWPHRKLMSLQTLITNVQELHKTSGNEVKGNMVQETITQLEEEKKKLEEIPDLQLQVTTKRLRQSCFKANYKKRKTMLGNRSSMNSSSSSCSSNCFDHGGFEVMEDGYYGDDHQEQEQMKSLLFTDRLSSSSNVLF